MEKYAMLVELNSKIDDCIERMMRAKSDNEFTDLMLEMSELIKTQGMYASNIISELNVDKKRIHTYPVISLLLSIAALILSITRVLL